MRKSTSECRSISLYRDKAPSHFVPISKQLPGHRELRRLAPGAEQTEPGGDLRRVRAELPSNKGAVQVVEERRVALRPTPRPARRPLLPKRRPACPTYPQLSRLALHDRRARTRRSRLDQSHSD